MSMGKDDWTPAIQRLVKNASAESKKAILSKLGNQLSNSNKRNIEAEKQYDGSPMKSPSKKPRADGKFAESYKWRYRPGFRALKIGEQTRQKVGEAAVRKRGGKIFLVGTARRRVPVTEASKQLQDTGATIKSIDILSVSANRAIVGAKTGHGQLILSVHTQRPGGKPKRNPFGISDAFVSEAQKYAFDELMKGV